MKLRGMRQAGHVAHMGVMRNVYIVVGKPVGMRPLRRPRYKDNIKMNLKQIGCKYVDCIQLAHNTNKW
jgi:hypothetical protein